LQKAEAKSFNNAEEDKEEIEPVALLSSEIVLNEYLEALEECSNQLQSNAFDQVSQLRLINMTRETACQLLRLATAADPATRASISESTIAFLGTRTETSDLKHLTAQFDKAQTKQERQLLSAQILSLSKSDRYQLLLA
jgi:hypothetical protein